MLKTRDAVILSVSWLFTFSLTMAFPKFAYLMGYSPGPSPFMDLQAVLTLGDCRGVPLHDVINGVCDPWERPWCYGVWIIHLVQFLHLSNDYFLIFGWLNALLIAICLGFVTKYFVSNVKWAYLVAFSPPIFFLAERANSDSLVMIFTVILLFSIIHQRNKWFFWIPALLIGAKVYPAAIFLAFTKFKDFFWAMLATLFFALFWIRDIGTILGNQIHCRSWTFGNIVYYTQTMNKCYDYGEISTTVTILLAIGSILLWLAFYIFLRIFRPTTLSKFTNLINSDEVSQTLVRVSGAIFLLCFLGVSMVAYKLWCVALLAIGVSRLNINSHKTFRAILFSLLLAGLWGTRISPVWVQILANWALTALSFLVFAYIVQDLLDRLRKSGFALK
ncbi:MAG: hypothetical protein F2768_03655 [Actinobacteria bacterium]|uniref:Unannotated protein n=1 Tax=freshwater metagenome TaxID=449393 RepID=A0A6J7BCY0_9ZZZZ|nr:hypothetical protein [Actinomycetota bacterium]